MGTVGGGEKVSCTIDGDQGRLMEGLGTTDETTHMAKQLHRKQHCVNTFAITENQPIAERWIVNREYSTTKESGRFDLPVQCAAVA